MCHLWEICIGPLLCWISSICFTYRSSPSPWTRPSVSWTWWATGSGQWTPHFSSTDSWRGSEEEKIRRDLAKWKINVILKKTNQTRSTFPTTRSLSFLPGASPPRSACWACGWTGTAWQTWRRAPSRGSGPSGTSPWGATGSGTWPGGCSPNSPRYCTRGQLNQVSQFFFLSVVVMYEYMKV